MTCPKCGSENVNVQAVSITKTKKHGMLYWISFMWLIDMMVWIFFFLPRLIIGMLSPGKVKTKVKSMAVCQSCGKRWNV